MFIEAVREWRQQFTGDLRDPEPWLLRAFGIHFDDSGMRVGPRSALESTPFLRGVRLICETYSAVPVNLMQRGEDGRKKEILRDEPAHWLVHAEPNEMMSSAVWRQVQMLHTLTHGNGYNFIERRRASRQPVALLPLDPGRSRAVLENGRFFYESVGENGKREELAPGDVLHLPWLSWDGIRGESPAILGRRSIGLGMAAEEAGARFFGQGMTSSGVIEQTAGQGLTEEGLKQLREAVAAKFSGLKNIWKPLILKPGLTWKQLSVNPDNAQARELLEANVGAVARILGVPLHLLASLETGAQSYASVEQFELIFYKHTMLPWFFLAEQELNRKLLPVAQRGRRFFRFNVEGLLRGDFKTRMEGHEIAIRTGLRSVNRLRDIEDEELSDEPNADQPLIMASNLAPLSQVGKPPVGANEPKAAPPAPTRAVQLERHLARRCVGQLTATTQRISEKYAGDRGRFEQELRDGINRVADDYADLFDRRHFEFFERQVREAESSEGVGQVVAFWKSRGPDVLTGGTPQ